VAAGADRVRGTPARPEDSERDRHQGETGVARTTARRAVKVLRDEGLVITYGGRGSYVAER